MKKNDKKKTNWFYALSFRELCDMLNLTPYQRAKLAKWFFREGGV